MAMDGNQLGAAIANAIMNASAPNEVKVQVIELWKKIGTEIVNHIKTNGIVNTGITVQVDPNSGAGSTTAAGTIQ